VSLFGARRHPRTAPLPVEGLLPGFEGATGWLNSSPLTPEGLAGKVVLVDFWTYTCINWFRTLAFVRAWSEKYRDLGLVVIGVHTPEFPFEREVDNVRQAAWAMGVEYPVALDSDYGVWSTFANRVAGRLPRRRGGPDPVPPLRRRRVRRRRVDDPTLAARGPRRGHR
jgi:thiol-disulfide isomerase/thioredoxin